MGYFLPPKRFITWPFIRQVLEGSKKLIKQRDVRINIIPPKIRDLTVKSIWAFLKNDPELMKFFPDACVETDPPREFFFSIVSSVRPDIFERILQQAETKFWTKIHDKNEVVNVDQNLFLELNSVNIKQSIYGRKSDKRVSLKQRRFDDDEEG